MAKLVKLQISGIRSFGPFEEHSQQLKFASPVTLILGQNGCGKTTIIEAIKYACSAEVPGGTYCGQAFVNDPKMSGSISTLGQIKLKVLDPKGNDVTVSRIVEVSRTATSMKFCSKDSSIKITTPNQEEKSLSGRCADITAELCQLMDVSPAVLNNVIFCHQENSAWPMDEAKKLKERFDEIFDAQKYNRCSDIFRKDLKEKEGNVKVLKSELLHRKENKQRVDKLKRSLQEREEKHRRLENDITTKNQQLEPIEQRINEILQLEQDLSNLNNELTKQKERKNGIQAEQNTIKQSLKFEFEGSDEDLQNSIKSFEEDRKKDQNSIAELEKRKYEIEEKNKQISNIIQETQTLLGKLNQEKSQYEKKCLERKKLIEEMKTKMEITDLRDFSDDDGAKAAIDELKNNLETCEMCLASLIDEQEQEQNRLQDIIDKAREGSVRARQNKQSKEKEIRECEQKIEDIDNQFTVLSTNDDFLRTCTQKIDNLDKTLYKLKNSFQETEGSQKIDFLRNKIQADERNLESLEADYKVLLQNEVTEGKIESERRTMLEKQKQINRIKSKHSDSLKQLFPEKSPETGLKETILAMQKNADATVKNLTEMITKKQKEVTTLEVQRQNQLEKISTCERELKNNREKIVQTCNGANFNETLNTSFRKKERLQIDKGQYSSVKIIYGQFIKKFEEESPCCPVCESDFSQKRGIVQKIITTLKSKLDKVPQELTRVEKDLEKEEALYSKLQQLKFVNEEVEMLEKEKLPQFRQHLNEIDNNLKNHLNELNELKLKLKEPQKIFEISKNIISDVSSLDQNQSDVDECRRTVESLQQDLVQVASKKSKQEVEAEIDHVKSEITELRGKVDSQTKKLNSHRDRVQQLLQDKNALITKQLQLQENLQSRPALETQKSELFEKVKNLKEEISKLQTDLYLLEGELKNSIENRENVLRKNKNEVQKQRNLISNYSKVIQDIDTLQKDIDVYLNSEVDRKLTETEDKLKECKIKENTLEETKSTIMKAISEKKEKLGQHELHFRTLQQNVVLREKKRFETKLDDEIANLKKRIGGYNYRSVYEEKRRLALQRENLDREINNMTGENNALKETITEYQTELNKPENKKADLNYIKKLCELKITEKVINDLKIFIISLEKAVLEFHKSKMVQINTHIRELWRDIYRGNDIDHIEIKTEYASTSTIKRSYNYKVIQVKRGVELDMRGRCSAGQKVLACLIIRMALAETLSSTCGILALDEPTTNLDRENIHSLSDTLCRIIRRRQQESNFQLLIITHDEEFLNILSRIQGISHYYRVLRDDDGFSVIKKEYSNF